MKRGLSLLVALVALSSFTGCVGVMLDLMTPEYDNLVVQKDFKPDPMFGFQRCGTPGRNPEPILTANQIAKLPGVVWLELVVGPAANMAGDASGFMVWFAGKPHIISAGHIAKGSKYKAIYAYFSEGQKQPEEVEIVVADELLDFALLRFKNADFKYDKPYPKLGQSAKTQRGDKVFPYGSPFGFEFMVREGVVSKLDSGLNTRGLKQPQIILHDATLNPGDSGGPLFNDLGEVVGINVMGLNPTAGHRSAVTTISAAIPIDDVIRVLRGVKKSGYVEHLKAGWKLYDTTGLNPLNFEDKKVPRPKRDGLMVYVVDSGGPAEKAGLKVGDVLLEYDGRKPTNYNEIAQYILFEKAGGEDLLVKIYRETHTETLEYAKDEKGYPLIVRPKHFKSEELELKLKLE